jgi:diguanylate cyclase (GGDEF)-like protein
MAARNSRSVLPGIDSAMALTVAERVRKAVFAARIAHAASTLGRISLSVGAASLIPIPQHSARLLVRLADQALYRAKHAGRNRACMAGMPESTEVATQAASTRKSSKRATT